MTSIVKKTFYQDLFLPNPKLKESADSEDLNDVMRIWRQDLTICSNNVRANGGIKLSYFLIRA